MQNLVVVILTVVRVGIYEVNFLFLDGNLLENMVRPLLPELDDVMLGH